MEIAQLAAGSPTLNNARRQVKLHSPFNLDLLRLGLLAVVAVAAVLLAACGSSPPRIVVEPASQDLGERPQEPLELSYTVRNEGGSPLQIEKVSTSCDCTTAAVESDTIPPGGSAKLRVTLDPTEDNIYGNLLRVIYLRSNDPAAPEVEVEFRVTIRKPEG